MLLNRCASWLGFKRSETLVGLHLGAEYASLVALRSDPLELCAVGRQIIFDAAVATDEERLIQNLSTDVWRMVEELRLTPDTPTVATIEPLADTLTLVDASKHQSVCDVRKRVHDRLITVVRNAGLKLERLDPVPISLARLGRFGYGPCVAVRAPSRWTIVTSEGFTEAERSPSVNVSTLCMGADLGSTRPVNTLPGITVPTPLRGDVDPTRDAPAVGAALALLDHLPMVSARAIRTEHLGSEEITTA